VLQLHGCVWAANETTWIPPDAWAACGNPSRTLEPGERIVLGFDGSERRDSTALIACTTDGFLQPIEVWERPARADSEWRIPRHEVHAAIAQAFDTYDVAELSVDLPGWYSEADEWAVLYGDAVVEFTTGQPKKVAPACDRFRAGVLDRTLTHSGHPVLSAHVGHCVARETPFGTVVTKDHPDSPRKIDAAVAAVVAFERAAVAGTLAMPWISWD
jgi:phage terminase large subunit-like protein